MKKVIIITLCTLCLFGCKTKEMNLKDYINDKTITELDDNNMPVSLLCNLGSGQIKEISDEEAILSVFDDLQKVKLQTSSAKSDLQIDDGDIGFIFKLKDGSEIKYLFLTSEYYFDGQKYITVSNPEIVRDAMQIARYADEIEEDIDTDQSILSKDSIEAELGSIDVSIIDNGDEAANVAVFTPSWNDQELYLENVYSIKSAVKTDNGILLTCECGDFYSHDTLQDFLLTIKDKQIEINVVEAK